MRAVFTAAVYALTSGCAWRHLPPTFGTSPATAPRRFTVWTEAGLWRRLHREVLDGLGARGGVDWTSAIVDAASVRAKRRGIADRAEPGPSRQEGQRAARAVRCPGHPARRLRVRREHARQPRPRTAHPRHTHRPVPPDASVGVSGAGGATLLSGESACTTRRRARGGSRRSAGRATAGTSSIPPPAPTRTCPPADCLTARDVT
ncbi:transposase [Streptomyces sp. NPDC054845]